MAQAQARDRTATRRRIFDAARELFTERGYDHVTMRMIATAAGVNVALVNRYFVSKADLFTEVVNATSVLESVIEGDPEGLPARLAAHMTRRLVHGVSDPHVRIFDRAGTSPEIQAVLRTRVRTSMIDRLRAQLSGPRAEERAMLATAVLLGTGSVRRMLGLDALPIEDPAALQRRLTAVFTACLAP